MTENNIPFEQKVKEGMSLSIRLFEFSLELSKKISKEEDKGTNETDRRAVLKGFLLSAAQLSGQIVKAVSQRSLSLAVVGLRSLLEFDINANYIFDNPKHKHDLVWADKLCKDIFDKTNHLGMQKSRLGGVGLKRRSQEINRLDLYEQNYASLCDYAHLVLRHPFLNKEEISRTLSLSIISQGLCNLTGVIDSVIVFKSFKWDEKLLEDVKSFRDRYELPL